MAKRKKFSETERKLIQLLPIGTKFNYERVEYTVSQPTCKPTVAKGECKTDVYVETTFKGGTRIFKISVKQTNADFLENKISHERATEIFGAKADEVIMNATCSIGDVLKNTPLVYFEPSGKTSKNNITLGWKFEFLNVQSGKRSGALKLSKQQIVDVYSGTSLPSEKKDAIINGSIVPNSGVAEFIIVLDPNEDVTIKKFEDNIKTISEFIEENNPVIYFACKALNYRLDAGKWDGNRPLSVYVDWSIKDGKLNAELKFDKPLYKRGNEIGNKVKELLAELSITAANFSELKTKLNASVTTFG